MARDIAEVVNEIEEISGEKNPIVGIKWIGSSGRQVRATELLDLYGRVHDSELGLYKGVLIIYNGALCSSGRNEAPTKKPQYLSGFALNQNYEKQIQEIINIVTEDANTLTLQMSPQGLSSFF
jgi:hypothetical protein